ncbi:hypothetical protein RJ639_027699 [Escallonia herrerae]|uniref:lipoyl(octanoyl) transferase n=1 Tax=Escallonia herrerae TaxID=1293975 RepID=A0AA89BEU1_9ASTE|nr:hypothetical protein RJ639_027699 [Escallonia herrerae]
MYKEKVPYAEAWSWQKSIVKQRKALIEQDEDCSDTLIILQHHPVYTLGTASTEKNLNFDISDAPCVMYPIVNLRYHKMDLHWYLRALEEVVIRVLSNTFSIKACRLEGLTGVWVGDQKLAAIGIRVSQWITYHGLALNVTTDLKPFQEIVPCGIRDRRVGSIKGVLRDHVSCDDCGKAKMHLSDEQLVDITHKSLVKEFCKVFQVEICHRPIPMQISEYYSSPMPLRLVTGSEGLASLELKNNSKYKVTARKKSSLPHPCTIRPSNRPNWARQLAKKGATETKAGKPITGQVTKTANRGANTFKPIVKKADVKYPLRPVIRPHRFGLNCSHIPERISSWRTPSIARSRRNCGRTSDNIKATGAKTQRNEPAFSSKGADTNLPSSTS